MESHAPLSLYIQQNSKKRVFPGGSSSSSSGCKDVEVLEIPPPSINRTPKPRSSKQKEVIFHEIIDVDMEEDCNDVMLNDTEVKTGAKGKEALLCPSVGHVSLDNHESNNGAVRLPDSANTDDFSSDLFYGEDDWIDTYYDDILYDDFAVLESHFDHMDIPPGVEAPFPWLPTPPTDDVKLPTSSTSTNPLQPDGVNLSPALNSSLSSWPLTQDQTEDLSVSWNNSLKGLPVNAGSQNMKGKSPSKSATSRSRSSKGPLAHKWNETSHSFGKSKRKSRASRIIYSNHYNQIPTYSSKNNSGGIHMALGAPMIKTELKIYTPSWQELPLNMLEPSLGPSGVMNGSTFSSWAQEPANNQNVPSSLETLLPTTVKQINVDEILQSFDLFKKFDTVEDYSDHYYSKNGSSTKQPPKNWAKRIQEEWKILEKDLPDEIFVRVYESRMDLLRAVIVGAEGTPYHDGLFFFDVFFPSSYPNVPPHVHYHSGGLRINPNLYHCGKVCLSLLNTWSGSQKEKWIPGVSTMLQVLVSIQGLILNANPFFNEPGYANLSGSVGGDKRSLEYNERTFMHSLQTMVYNMRRPPKYFEDFVVGHFHKHAHDILVSCKAYLEGAQVGCLVKGGVQDVDEGDKSCSMHFKHSLARFITLLVNTFSEIGAKDYQEFLSLAQKGNGPPPAAASQWPLNFTS